MSLADRIIYQPPGPDADLTIHKEAVDGLTCERCGSTDIRRYPVTWSRGPRIVTKCQSCYAHLDIHKPGAEDPWPPFRAVAYDWDVSPAERPSLGAGN